MSPAPARRRAWPFRLLLLALAAWGAAACTLTEPLPSDAAQFDPPAIYRRWWAMTEACSGISGDLSDITWFRVPGNAVEVHGTVAGGYWTSGGNRIVLTADNVDDGGVVRHEMLHALLRNIAGQHPRAWFLELCGSVVVCEDECVADAGPWRAPGPYVWLRADSLDVDSEATLLPRESDGQRWVSMLVTVKNPRAFAVMVPAPLGTSTQRGFMFDVRGPTGGRSVEDFVDDSSRMYFAPHETKTQLYEFRVAGELTSTHIVAGRNLLGGGFARHRTAFDTVNVSP